MLGAIPKIFLQGTPGGIMGKILEIVFRLILKVFVCTFLKHFRVPADNHPTDVKRAQRVYLGHNERNERLGLEEF